MEDLLKAIESGSGVLPDSLIRQAIAAGNITAGDYRIPDSLVQPASLDLRLGPIAYRLRSSFLPGDRTVAEQLREYQLGGPIDLRDGAVLETNRPYLIPLIEHLALPPRVRARANPKSSIGRIDVFTRLVVDRSAFFDEVPAGYHGPLYLELISQSFLIFVKERLSVNQVRLIVGDPRLDDADLHSLHRKEPVLYSYPEGRAPVPVADTSLALSSGLFLSVDLSADGKHPIGYKAKKNSLLLDLDKVGGHRLADFWEPVHAEQSRNDRRLILEPEEFYLLVSREGVAFPPDYAGDMTAYDPTSGELRTHYAGFFDPGFGFGEGTRGSRAVLEVRAHDVAFALEDGQKVARLVYERMLGKPDRLYGSGIGSSYQDQRLTLSKFFAAA